MNKYIAPGTLQGKVRIPGSKSHTIRALLIASLAEGTSTLRAPLYSADTESCIAACRIMGADIETFPDKIIVRGTGGRLKQPDSVIDVGNSGTTLYLQTAIAAVSSYTYEFTGDHQIQARPADKLLDALEDLGVTVTSTNKKAPFTVTGPFKGGETTVECPTSQYLSALLLAAPLAEGTTTINVPLLHEQPYVEMTLAWLDEQGIKYTNNDFKQFIVPGGQKYTAFDKPIAADFSSATFFACAAAICRSTITLEGLDFTDSQGDKGIFPILEKMGCNVSIDADALEVTVSCEKLTGTIMDLNPMPDALPAMAMTAALAEGETQIINVPQARLKETDRIAVMNKELSTLGVKVEEREDGLVIQGTANADNTPQMEGCETEGHHDHRIVMSMSIGSLATKKGISVDTAEAAAVTFPNFFELLDSLRV